MCQPASGAFQKVFGLVGADCHAENCIFRVVLNIKVCAFSPFKPTVGVLPWLFFLKLSRVLVE